MNRTDDGAQGTASMGPTRWKLGYNRTQYWIAQCFELAPSGLYIYSQEITCDVLMRTGGRGEQ